MSGIMRAAARGARRLESSRVTSHARASIAPFHRIDGSEKSWNPSAAQIREPVGLPGMTFTPWGGVSDGEKISALDSDTKGKVSSTCGSSKSSSILMRAVTACQKVG